MLKFISWNVNSLRACYDKGFADAFNRLEADFFCLQETKMQEGQLDVQFEGYQSYWNYAEKKGYSGTAFFRFVLGFFKSISLCAIFKSPHTITGFFSSNFFK